MFRKIFGAPHTPAHRVGSQLFQEGMNAAIEFRTAEAIALYTKSFEANPNPAPLINRSKLYRWRILYNNAIEDLEYASVLDQQHSNEFSREIDKELSECKIVAHNLFNGKIDLFRDDLQENGFDYVAGRIADVVFEGNGKLLAYHLINEIDNIKKFEHRSDFVYSDLLINNWIKDQSAIDQALKTPEVRYTYADKRKVFESMVCVHEYENMAKLRDTMVRKIWCLLTPPSELQPVWETSLRNPIA
jgi:tetratricopeptide (TPR) repeat protein